MNTEQAILIRITQNGVPATYTWEAAVELHTTMQNAAMGLQRQTADAFVRWGATLLEMQRSIEQQQGKRKWADFIKTAVNVKTAEKAMRLARVAAGADGALDEARTMERIHEFNATAADRGVRTLATNTVSKRSAEIAYGLRPGDLLSGPARDRIAPAPASAPAKPYEFGDECNSDPDDGDGIEISPEILAMSEEEREAAWAKLRREQAAEYGELDEDEESEDDDGDNAAHESGGSDAAGLSIGLAGAATTTHQKDLDTSSDAGSAGSSHHGVGGAGVVGFIGKGLGAGEQGLVMQPTFDAIYAEAARVRGVAGRMERGELSDAMRKRLMLLVAEIDGGNAT